MPIEGYDSTNFLFCPSESSHRVESLSSELKEDKITLKALKAELQQLKEEHFDVKNEKEAIEKVTCHFDVCLYETRNVSVRPFQLR